VTTAVELAVHFGAELVLVHVLAPPPMPPMVPSERMATLLSSVEVERYQRDEERQARLNLERLVAERLQSGLVYGIRVLVGNAAEAIVGLAREEAADLVVIATHGRSGWRRLAFGSVADKVIRTATCPVLVVPSPAQTQSSSDRQ